MQRVTHKQAVAIAGAFYRRLLSANEDDPGHVELVKGQVLLDKVAAADPAIQVVAAGRPDVTAALTARLRTRHRPDVVDFLKEQGMLVDDDSLERIVAAVNAAVVQAREQLLRNAGGDYRPDAAASRFPEWSSSAATKPPTAPVSNGRTDKDYELTGIFDRFSKEAGHSPATIKRWTPIIKAVSQEVKDIRDLTDIWCVGWKDRLVERGLSPASINDAYLAALRGTCSWAKKNLLISQNPVSGINVSAEKKGKTRPKGFTQGEALTILKATLAPVTQNL